MLTHVTHRVPCHFLLMFAVATTGTVACDDDSQTIGRPDLVSSVSVRDVDVGMTGFSFQVSKGPVERSVRLERRDNGVLADISDDSGRQLAQISVALENGTLIVTEKAENASLRIELTHDRERVEETYVQDGRTLVVTYPRIDRTAMLTQFEAYERGDFTIVNPELAVAVRDFEEFYSPSPSLHGNEDGELLVEALASQELRQAIQSPVALSKVQDGPLSCQKCLTYWCAGVGLITGIKCLFGGPVNLLCVMGGVIDLACAVFEIVCGVWDC